MCKSLLNSIFILFFLSIVSCQDDNKNQQIDSTNAINNLKHTLSIDIEYISNKDDVLRMIFNKTLFKEQLIDLTINKHIISKSKLQKLSFQMPIKGRPKSISIGLGNEEEKEIVLKKVKLNFDQNTFVINQKDIIKYFTLNKYVSFDKTTHTLKTKRINNLHSPVITFKPIVKKHTYR
ncbi:hypothetical protein [Olleya sp. R77988]|uniref:hypothetical protein n=1 Tax=Olleya sp. R77988 TaxID=3093875 RepID=UPI0037CCBA9C